MLPQSKVDLDELVKMMKENPNYEITVHGHCNGKYDRMITSLGASKNYFDLTNAHQFHGTAKELADLRAEAIRQYLTDNGIESRRVRKFAWGGRYMLVDPKSQHAPLNDRIEIEIRKH